MCEKWSQEGGFFCDLLPSKHRRRECLSCDNYLRTCSQSLLSCSIPVTLQPTHKGGSTLDKENKLWVLKSLNDGEPVINSPASLGCMNSLILKMQTHEYWWIYSFSRKFLLLASSQQKPFTFLVKSNIPPHQSELKIILSLKQEIVIISGKILTASLWSTFSDICS